MAKDKQVFQVIVEQDEDGYFVAECHALHACYTKLGSAGRSLLCKTTQPRSGDS